jgi:hypothetical protein
MNHDETHCLCCPLGHAAIPAEWLTPTVLDLATVAWDEVLEHGSSTAFGPLSDALEEEGCSDVELLTHLRSGDDHTPRCAVVRRILSLPLGDAETLPALPLPTASLSREAAYARAGEFAGFSMYLWGVLMLIWGVPAKILASVLWLFGSNTTFADLFPPAQWSTLTWAVGFLGIGLVTWLVGLIAVWTWKEGESPWLFRFGDKHGTWIIGSLLVNAAAIPLTIAFGTAGYIISVLVVFLTFASGAEE